MKPCDLETEGLDFNRHGILMVGYDKTCQPDPTVVQGPLTGQNFKFDYKFLKKAGIQADFRFDTMLAASILTKRPESLSLDELAAFYLGAPNWKDATAKMFKKKDWVKRLKADPELYKALQDRNIADLDWTDKLTSFLQARLAEEGLSAFFFDKIMPTAKMLAEVEYRGMRIDLPAVQKAIVSTNETLQVLKGKLDNWALPLTINWNSPKQLLPFLKSHGFNMWGYDFKTRAMKESTGTETLERLLPDENIATLLSYRKTKKLIGYLEGWLEENYNERLFPTFNMASTRTGRLSCSDPNLQQIPRSKEIRALFIPSTGKVFVIGDYAQIEPRIVAHYSQDPALLNVFKSKLDLYGSIAVNVLGLDCAPNDVKKKFPDMRKLAKEIGLSVLYGIGAAKLASLLTRKTGRVFTEAQAKKIIRDYFIAYPELLAFRQYVEKKAYAGEVMTTHYGRKFIIDPEKVYSTGVNTIVQSTASDACLFSQLEVNERLAAEGIDAPLVALIHDEIIRECNPKDAQRVGKIMEEIMCNQGFDCPLAFDWAVGNSWADKA